MPSPAPGLFIRPVGKWVGVAAGFAQVRFELRCLVLGVGTWRVRANDVARYQQPREFIESTQYLLRRVGCCEVECGGKTGGVIPGSFLEPLLFPRLLGGDLELKGSLHAYPKVRVGLDQTVERKCAHRPQTAKRERRSFGYYIISRAISMVLQWSNGRPLSVFFPFPDHDHR